jgi:hypothetical protein
MRDDLRDFVKFMRLTAVKMLDVQVKKLQVMRTRLDEAGDHDRAQGVQDSIDSILDTMAVGMSITDKDIDQKMDEVNEIYQEVMATKNKKFN